MGGYSETIISEAKRWGVADRVTLVGVVDEASKHWYLKNCTAFLFPSLAEGFGLPPIEAMSYGKPCFLSTNTCLPEIGGNMANYFIDMSDPEQMQSDFLEGLNRPIKTSDIIEHACSFSWKKAAKQYVEIYEQMLGL